MVAAPSSTGAYELLPSKQLPLLNMSRCLGGELVAWLRCRANRVAAKAEASTASSGSALHLDAVDLQRGLYARAALVAYNIGHVLAAVASVVPRTTGAALAITGLVLTLPGSLSGVALLRFDLMKLQVRAYEFWFYLLVNTVSTALLARGFGDARACIALVIWFGNLHSIVVDANTKLACYLVEASVATVALSLFVLLAMEAACIPHWKTHAIQSHVANGSPPFSTNNLISNALTTMMIVLCRNLYRRHHELIQAKKIHCPMMRCLNLRCTMAVQVADRDRLAELAALTSTQKHYSTGPQSSRSEDAVFPTSQMYNVRVHELYDGSQTLYPVQLDPLHWKPWEQLAFATLGGAGLAFTASVFGVYPSPKTQPTAVAGVCCTMAFTLVSLGLYQRKACLNIVLSFDYVFLSTQFSLGLWSTGMLFHWDIRSVALASMWLWLHWVLTIDALTPLMKAKIGFNTKLLLVPVLLLFLTAQMAMILEIAWLDHWRVRDRELLRVSGRFTMTLLPFLMSRVVLSSLWSLRVLWRIIYSANNDTVIVLGRLAFLHRALPGNRATATAKHVRPFATTQDRKLRKATEPVVA